MFHWFIEDGLIAGALASTAESAAFGVGTLALGATTIAAGKGGAKETEKSFVESCAFQGGVA
jgi:hypothetical protein